MFFHIYGIITNSNSCAKPSTSQQTAWAFSTVCLSHTASAATFYPIYE